MLFSAHEMLDSASGLPYVFLMHTPSRFHGPAARALREAHKIRQVELARRVGITRAALANIEAGRRQPNQATAQAIAQHLDCDLAAVTYQTGDAA